MVFASHSFLAFLLILLLIYWIGSRHDERLGKPILILASLVFYGFWIPAYLILLAVSIAFNHVFARALMAGPALQTRRLITTLGITLNLALIGFYKYAGFLVESFNWSLQTGFEVPNIILPIGISFFTFQQISLLIDAHKGQVQQLRFWDHVLFIAFFPQLIAGPIVRQHEMLPQLAERRDWGLRADYIAIGIALFAFGLFKKSAIIDPFVPYLDLIYQAAADGEAVGFLDGWIAGMGYGFQIYFDFSAYSDMAIGLGFIFGLRLPINFFSPYKAANIRDFWRRWHISLSSFLRDYLFIPLGGSHQGIMRTVAALMITMTLGGLWHGAGWTFVIWGALHGGFLAINHLWRAIMSGGQPRIGEVTRRRLRSVLRPASVVLTFLAVSFSWVFFRASDLDAALSLASAMLGLGSWHEVALLTRGIVPLFPIYLIIIWFLPNTMEIFQASRAALHIEKFRDIQQRPMRPAWHRFRSA